MGYALTDKESEDVEITEITPSTNEPLFVNHQLNYEETVRRIVYWAGKTRTSIPDVFSSINKLRLLVKLLELHKGNLYFEHTVEDFKPTADDADLSIEELKGLVNSQTKGESNVIHHD